MIRKRHNQIESPTPKIEVGKTKLTTGYYPLRFFKLNQIYENIPKAQSSTPKHKSIIIAKKYSLEMICNVNILGGGGGGLKPVL